MAIKRRLTRAINTFLWAKTCSGFASHFCLIFRIDYLTYQLLPLQQAHPPWAVGQRFLSRHLQIEKRRFYHQGFQLNSCCWLKTWLSLIRRLLKTSRRRCLFLPHGLHLNPLSCSTRQTPSLGEVSRAVVFSKVQRGFVQACLVCFSWKSLGTHPKGIRPSTWLWSTAATLFKL